MKKSFRIFITALSFLLISFSAAYADEQQETEAFQDSQSFTSYSDDFLLFDSETENFTKDKDGLYNWTGSFVLDAAKMLSKNERLSLKKFLRDLNDTSGIQIAVLTIPTTDGENIHDLAVRYFDKWELGQDGVDNGAILTIALDDRKNDITTGYGTEGILTDILCKKILDEVVKPAFRAGQYGDGIENAVKTMAGIIMKDESLVTVRGVDLPAVKGTEGLYEWKKSGVIDEAGFLSEKEKWQLATFLTDLNGTSGIQLALLTVSGSMDKESFSDFAHKSFDRWKEKNKNLDNGAVLSILDDDESGKYRFNLITPKNVSAIFPSEQQNGILSDYLVGKFHSGHYGECILNAMQKMAAIITQDESLSIPSGKLYEEKTVPEIDSTESNVRSLTPEEENKEPPKWYHYVAAIGIIILVAFLLIKRHIKKEKEWQSRPHDYSTYSSHSSSYDRDDSYSSRSSRSYSSSRSSSSRSSSSSSSHRSGGGGRTGGGGASSSW